MPLDLFGPATRAWFADTFQAPTRVQTAGWPHLVAGQHALLLAPTGSGKTLAAFLAALDALTRRTDDQPGVRVLYISPLKALVADIERNLRAPLVGIAHAAARLDQPCAPVRVDLRTGDTPAADRRLQAREPAEILVTTPESLYLILGGSARDTLRTVHTVIVDEIHVLAGSKRGAHLALSLERLAARCERDPQRIGLSATQRPLDTIARFLGGDRPVQVVDTSEPPHLRLTIQVPVDDMDRPGPAPAPRGGEGQRQRVGGPPPADGPNRLAHGLWPSIYPEILAHLRARRSTIVFTNSRLQCERIAQRLNELAGEELVRAHHGSVSHARRAETEELLKRGALPALVATSSLELGVDMGAVDLVILVESPGAVSRGLQRVGRAGHGVGQVSDGVIFPKHKGDLLECAVVAAGMAAGAIEPTQVPRNPLDVLAQQIVAMVATDPWTVPELGALVRRATPYAELSEALLTGVLDMLAGRYPSDDFAALAPRLVWDRATDQLSPRRGAATLARMNAGTIPDRGLYGVFLASGEGRRLGELDEEMVYETRAGDVIVLGASTWRVDQITRDRVLVTPAPGEPGRLPFWQGDRPGRPAELGRALGAFTREVASLPADTAADALMARAPLDARAAHNLLGYLRAQAEATERVPSDRDLVIERFRDELGDWRVCVLSPFGARVHAPWAMAVEAGLARDGHEVQSLWTDDGFSFRFADAETLPSAEAFLPDPDAVQDLLLDQLGRSALFAARFRENAARALLLPRRSFKGRSPLWQQRLRAQALQAVAVGYPAFPIVLETWRECLADVFDLDALRALLSAVQRREVGVHEVETDRPSPFARSLVFAATAASMYAGDTPLAERRALALTLDRDLLRDLLGEDALGDLVDPSVFAAVEAELQGLVPERAAAHADALHDLLRRVGDLSEAELQARAAAPVGPWLTELAHSRRAFPARVAGQARWIAAEDAARYRDGLGVPLPPGLPAAFLDPVPDALELLLLRWARTHGPFTAEGPAARFGLPRGAVEAVLRELAGRGRLLAGGLGGAGTWCDPDVMRRLRRRGLAELRREVEAVDAPVYARFLASWHGVDAPTRSGRAGAGRLREVLAQLEGLALPVSDLESRILPARVAGYEPRMLDELGMLGEVVWVGQGALGPKDGRVALIRRDRVGLWVDPPAVPDGLLDPADPDGAVRARLWAHLRARGACFVAELQGAADAGLADVVRALWDLVWAGLVTNDTFLPLRGLQARSRAGSLRRSRYETVGGRWSAVSALVPPPSPEAATARAHARALALLERHGVATAAAAQAEGWPGGFASVYPVLRAMEEAGRARRGWFVDGLEGAQFALPGAVDRLRAHRPEAAGARVLAATDPASPWGATLPWPHPPGPTEARAALRRDAGALVVSVGGAPVLYLGRGGRSLAVFTVEPEPLSAACTALRAAVRRPRIERINTVAALGSPLRPALEAAGFVGDPKGLSLP